MQSLCHVIPYPFQSTSQIFFYYEICQSVQPHFYPYAAGGLFGQYKLMQKTLKTSGIWVLRILLWIPTWQGLNAQNILLPLLPLHVLKWNSPNGTICSEIWVLGPCHQVSFDIESDTLNVLCPCYLILFYIENDTLKHLGLFHLEK